MKNILFAIVAAALVSMAPFLVLFDPECYPSSHGIIGFSVLALLMLYTMAKGKCHGRTPTIILNAITYTALAIISWIDLQGILDLLKLSTGLYGTIPFTTPAIALLILKNTKAIPFGQINLTLFSIFFLHLLLFYTEINQPLLDFPLLNIM